jgi:hypothetical protein
LCNKEPAVYINYIKVIAEAAWGARGRGLRLGGGQQFSVQKNFFPKNQAEAGIKHTTG